MIKATLQGNSCLIEVQGPLSKADFEAIASQVDPIIEKDGQLDGLVIKTRDFPGWETLGDVIGHFRFVKDHHKAIRRVSLATDAKIARVFPSIANHFVEAEVKHFDFDAYEEAVQWVAQSSPPQAQDLK